MPRKKKGSDWKRPNGYGSVYKLSGNRRRPWVARITLECDEDNKQLREIIGYYQEEKEAREALDRHRLGIIVPKPDVTWGYLYNEWSEGKYQHISKQTADNYRAAWNYLSTYKNTKVTDLRTAHLQKVIDKCHQEKMSRSTLEKLRIVALSLFNYALENDIVTKNYANFLRLPKIERVEKSRFNDLEIQKLNTVAQVNEWVATALIMIYTGMRISEMLGLTKFNISLEQGIIKGGVKTDAGKNRVIPIHPKITKYINYWYNKNGQTLICDKEGAPLSAKRYREKFYYPALEAAKVRKLVPHACRHTFGSLMAEAGVDAVHIQKLIGHANYAFTADKYTHLELEALKGAISKI